MSSTRFLDPIERTLEVLFGLIMVLVFTAAIDVGDPDAAGVHGVLVGAIGCNIAWGVVDAVMYLMANFSERARGVVMLKAVRASRDPGTAYHLIADVLPPRLAAMLGASEYESLRRRVTAGTETPRPTLGRDDYLGAAGVFLLVCISTFPVVIPFLVMDSLNPAMRLSQAIAAVLLFLVGWNLGVHTGRPGWRTGLVVVAVGAALTALTFVLGG